jgi:hypothetical protein
VKEKRAENKQKNLLGKQERETIGNDEEKRRLLEEKTRTCLRRKE